MRATFGDYRSKMAKEEKDIKFSKFESNRNLKTASFKISLYRPDWTADNVTIIYYLVESSVTLGDCSRAQKSKYLKMKQCTSSTGRTSNISSESSRLNIDQTNIPDISTELSQRLKASDLDDKTEIKETGFRFNFKVDPMITSATKNVPEEVISKPEADTSQHPKLSCKGLKYAASDNSFRFNFPS